MEGKTKNIYEHKDEPLNEIAKKVNAFLDPIFEKQFDLKTRKAYLLANKEYLDEQKQKILERAKNLGFEGKGILDQKTAQDYIDAHNEFEKGKKILEETRPDAALDFNLDKEIRKYDKDGRLEKKIAEVYGISNIKPKVRKWDYFLILLSAALRADPFLWDQLKEKSEK